MKMKVGDKVRAKPGMETINGNHPMERGKIYTISNAVEYNNNSIWYISFVGEGTKCYLGHRLEIVNENPYAFKVGDKVIVIESTDMLGDKNIVVGEIHQVTKCIGPANKDGGVNLLGKGCINYGNFRFKLVSDSAPKECSHDMKQYIGFTETYMYCTKCDRKEK